MKKKIRANPPHPRSISIPMPTDLYLVRHGENQANLTKEFSHRRVDYPLTDKGRLQAAQTGDYFRPRQIAAVYASPLRRARETAAAIAAACGLTPAVVENFREINVGDLEDQPPTPENWALHNAILRAWRSGEPERCFPGGENLQILWARVRAGYVQVLAAHPGASVVIIGHGGVIALTTGLLCPAADMETALRQENHNCSVTHVRATLEAGEPVGELLRFSAADHLHGAAAQVISGIPDEAFWRERVRG